jgi:hypothetical protein
MSTLLPPLIVLDGRTSKHDCYLSWREEYITHASVLRNKKEIKRYDR